MSTFTVTTQTQLDEAIAKATRYDRVTITSSRGVWLRLSAFDSATVEAFGSATVRASGSATVRAFGSATVRAFDSATVEASGSATVEASGSATVRAFGSATVRAFDSATVRAFDSATVRAFDSATVEAFDSATVRASKYVAVHLHSARATISGGVVIDVTAIDMSDPREWCAYTGAEIDEAAGTVILYKSVNPDLVSQRGMAYPIGQTVTAPDWRDTDECGYGLHFCSTPHQAEAYGPTPARYLAVRVPLDGLRPITDRGTPKCKTQSCEVLHEVDVFGRRAVASPGEQVVAP